MSFPSREEGRARFFLRGRQPIFQILDDILHTADPLLATQLFPRHRLLRVLRLFTLNFYPVQGPLNFAKPFFECTHSHRRVILHAHDSGKRQKQIKHGCLPDTKRFRNSSGFEINYYASCGKTTEKGSIPTSVANIKKRPKTSGFTRIRDASRAVPLVFYIGCRSKSL